MERKLLSIARRHGRRLVPVFVMVAALIAGLLFAGGTVPAFGVKGSLVGVMIVLDPGHGGFDGGAVSADGAREDRINLAVANYLREELIGRGAGVALTRENDDALADNKRDDMLMRRDIVKNSGAHLMISIHMNKFPDKGTRGPQVFYMQGSEGGKRLAESIQARLNKASPQERKRVALTGDYFMLRTSDATAVIVECGFMSNKAEAELLQSESYQKKLAAAIAAGVADYIDVVGLGQDYQENGSRE